MKRLLVFVADVDAEHTHNICRTLSHCPVAKVVGTAVNGNEALRKITQLCPDVLLTDILLPGKSGVDLIRESRLVSSPPVSIVCTRCYSECCLEHAIKSGAAYVLYKPIEYKRLPAIISECHKSTSDRLRENHSQNFESEAVIVQTVRSMLVEMGIPVRLSGSLYTVESILLLRENPLLLGNLAKGLYAEIAGRTGTTPACVERSIRNALSIAYNRGSLAHCFSHRPSNKEFIAHLLRRLEMERDNPHLADPHVDSLADPLPLCLNYNAPV